MPETAPDQAAAGGNPNLCIFAQMEAAVLSGAEPATVDIRFPEIPPELLASLEKDPEAAATSEELARIADTKICPYAGRAGLLACDLRFTTMAQLDSAAGSGNMVTAAEADKAVLQEVPIACYYAKWRGRPYRDPAKLRALADKMADTLTGETEPPADS